MQAVCSVDCSIGWANIKKAKKQAQEATRKRVEHRKEKERIKSRGDWIKEAQAAFNRWIRARDAELPCISCGRFHDGQFHAGHYRTTASAPELRFNENNVHKQCSPCNLHKHGNVIEYRINLVKRIGIELVEWLEGHHEPKKYTIEELKQIKTKYSALVKALEKK